MSDKRDKKSKREQTLSNISIHVEDASEVAFETKPLKVK